MSATNTKQTRSELSQANSRLQEALDAVQADNSRLQEALEAALDDNSRLKEDCLWWMRRTAYSHPCFIHQETRDLELKLKVGEHSRPKSKKKKRNH